MSTANSEVLTDSFIPSRAWSARRSSAMRTSSVKLPSTKSRINDDDVAARVNYQYIPVDINLNSLRIRYDPKDYNDATSIERQIFLQNFDALSMYDDLEMIYLNWAALKLQNYLLNEFLEQNDPKLLIGLSALARMGEKRGVLASRSQMEDKQSRAGSKTNPSILSNTTTRKYAEFSLNYKAKASMAEKSANAVVRSLKTSEKDGYYELLHMRCDMRELNIRIRETNDIRENFLLYMLRDKEDRLFLKKATEKQLMHKFSDFVRNWEKAAMNILSNIRIAISTASSRCERYRAELMSKTDMKGILTAVDYEKMLISRSELSKVIADKNRNMAGIKTVSGRASMRLAEQKRIMDKLDKQMLIADRRIKDAHRNYESIKREIDKVLKTNAKQILKMERIKEQTIAYIAPSIAEYIALKTLLTHLVKDERVLRRKINIGLMKLRNAKRKVQYKSIPTKN